MENNTMETTSLRYMVLAALFAALTSVGAYIAIPIGPVPIVLSNLFVLIAGLLLGKKWAPASMGIYLFLGAIGLPVFAQGASGPAVLIGPTGGFLFGYVLASFVIAFISSRGESALWKDAIAVLCGIALIYLLGVPWLKFKLSLEWGRSFTLGMQPFILGDLLKGVAAIILVKFLRPQLNDR